MSFLYDFCIAISLMALAQGTHVFLQTSLDRFGDTEYEKYKFKDYNEAAHITRDLADVLKNLRN